MKRLEKLIIQEDSRRIREEYDLMQISYIKSYITSLIWNRKSAGYIATSIECEMGLGLSEEVFYNLSECLYSHFSYDYKTWGKQKEEVSY